MSWFLAAQPKIKTEITKSDSTVDNSRTGAIFSPESEELCQVEKIKSERKLNFNPTESCEIGPESARQRRQEAYQIRQQAALFEKNIPLPGHPCNGDEFLYPDKIGNYSKALPHNNLGQVALNAYQAMIEALTTGNPEFFALIPLGGVVKLTNPQSAYAFEMTGPDSHHLSIIAPPTFNSPWNASEMDELYWMALTRDVPFSEYATNPLTLAAAAELTGFADFRGPKVNGAVTPKTLFRFDLPGALEGLIFHSFY